MKSSLSILVLTLSISSLASAQKAGNWPTPPASADKSSSATPSTTPKLSPPRVDLEREAREILELSQSLQLDMQQVARGVLPKDTIAKLKRIEKLSHHLRGELAP